jgi:hypothetical protein
VISLGWHGINTPCTVKAYIFSVYQQYEKSKVNERNILFVSTFATKLSTVPKLHQLLRLQHDNTPQSKTPIPTLVSHLIVGHRMSYN